MSPTRHSRCAVVLLLSVVAIAARAQTPPQMQSAPAGSAAQAAAGGASTTLSKRGWLVTPSVTLDRTYTDNVFLQQSAQSDIVTRLVPQLTIDGQSARAKGTLDFRVQKIGYANHEDRDRVQRYLNANGTVEMLDRWMYLDLSSNITRMPVSVFAPASTGTESINPNVVETRNYRVSPYVRGHLGNFADYLLRLDSTRISSSSAAMRSINTRGMQLDLSGRTGLAMLGWRVNVDTQQTLLADGTRNENDTLRATLVYNLSPQFKALLITGEESQNYSSFKNQTSSINGAGFEWAPTERTQVAYTGENRYFGTGHTLNFAHRTPHTAWRYTDRRDVQVKPPQAVTYSRGSYYDLFYNMYETSIPDPIERARFVQALMQTLQIPLDAQVLGGSLTSRASLNRTQELSFTVNGVRNTLTVSVQRSNRSAVGTGINVVDDFSQSSSFQQQGVNANWSYRLSQNSTLALLMSHMRSSGSESGPSQQLTRDMLSLNLNSKLGQHTNGSLGVRRTDSSGNFQYVENAVTASVVLSF